ncbi:MAG: hypothetical protein WC942_03695 [Clostridia bacterium]|jgi:predicted phosphodiesterase
MAAHKLDPQIEEKIKSDLETTGMSQRDIGIKYSVSQGYVNNICRKYSIKRPRSTATIKAGVDPTNERILSLEADVLALKDERAGLKKAYNAAQRKNSIFQALAEEIKSVVKPIKPLPPAPFIAKAPGSIKESLVMHLSDEHGADIVLPHQVGGLENYNMGVALRRAETYVDSTIKFTQKILKGYTFGTLYILANGDHVSGEIHNAVDHTEHRNIFRNCISVGQMHALMFRDLAPYFEAVKVVYTPGNHGRRSIKKDYNLPRDNWDYLVAEIAASYCRDLVNVEFLIPDSYSVNIEIEGRGFHVTHGDDIKSWSGIPWYGIERKTRRLTALNCSNDKKIDYFCFGHFHNPATQSALRGETIINGSWVATSPYVYNSLSSFNEPSQIIHGVHKERGISWRLHVKLRTDDEHLGPRRYTVVMAK